MRPIPVLLSFALFASSAHALPPVSTGTHRPHLDYHVIAAEGVALDSPIVIAIHGLGDDRWGFAGLVRRLQLPWRFVLPNGPRRHHQGYSWYRVRSASSAADVEGSTALLRELVRSVRRRWPAAPRPYLLGFSQGGVMGFSMAARAGRELSGVVAAAGYLVPNDLNPPRARKRQTPILIIHGRGDTVVPFEEGREAAQKFRGAGFKVTFRAHHKPHFIPRDMNPKIRNWLLHQHGKNATP